MAKSNRVAKAQIVEIHGNRCMLTNVNVDVNKKYKLTYHHIEKKEFGGQATIENGANLIDRAHEWLHNAIEYKDPELFMLINECLLNYKEAERLGNVELVNQFENECMPIFKQLILKKEMK